ncbi:hypothetical protein [Ornithinimicrobium kibberense]|uniref:hypothetical protein n=1 Tax=Ornithinimicrobium kibberense TaxID=282060 RepID=UPI00361003FF
MPSRPRPRTAPVRGPSGRPRPGGRWRRRPRTSRPRAPPGRGRPRAGRTRRRRRTGPTAPGARTPRSRCAPAGRGPWPSVCSSGRSCAAAGAG